MFSCLLLTSIWDCIGPFFSLQWWMWSSNLIMSSSSACLIADQTMMKRQLTASDCSYLKFCTFANILYSGRILSCNKVFFTPLLRGDNAFGYSKSIDFKCNFPNHFYCDFNKPCENPEGCCISYDNVFKSLQNRILQYQLSHVGQGHDWILWISGHAMNKKAMLFLNQRHCLWHWKKRVFHKKIHL